MSSNGHKCRPRQNSFIFVFIISLSYHNRLVMSTKNSNILENPVNTVIGQNPKPGHSLWWTNGGWLVLNCLFCLFAMAQLRIVAISNTPPPKTIKHKPDIITSAGYIMSADFDMPNMDFQAARPITYKMS